MTNLSLSPKSWLTKLQNSPNLTFDIETLKLKNWIVMWEFIHKVLLLFIERKDKYKHAEEKLQRRVDYFNELKTIKESNLDEEEKRARRNAIAQRLVGSQLVSFELVDYLIKNKNINNFEEVAKRMAFWDSSLNIERDNDLNILDITLNNTEFFQERGAILFTFIFNICIFAYSLYIYKVSLFWLKNYLLIPEYLSKLILISLSLLLFITSFLLFISTLVLFDLKRVVELLNKKAP